MTETMAGRLASLIANLGITQADFAQRVGFTQSYISTLINNKRPHPSPRFFDAVAREFNVNPGWLKAGTGEVFAVPGEAPTSPDAEIIAKYRLLPRTEQAIVDEIIDAFLVRSMTKK